MCFIDLFSDPGNNMNKCVIKKVKYSRGLDCSAVKFIFTPTVMNMAKIAKIRFQNSFACTNYSSLLVISGRFPAIACCNGLVQGRARNNGVGNYSGYALPQLSQARIDAPELELIV